MPDIRISPGVTVGKIIINVNCPECGREVGHELRDSEISPDLPGIVCRGCGNIVEIEYYLTALEDAKKIIKGITGGIREGLRQALEE